MHVQHPLQHQFPDQTFCRRHHHHAPVLHALHFVIVIHQHIQGIETALVVACQLLVQRLHVIPDIRGGNLLLVFISRFLSLCAHKTQRQRDYYDKSFLHCLFTFWVLHHCIHPNSGIVHKFRHIFLKRSPFCKKKALSDRRTNVFETKGTNEQCIKSANL